MLVCNVTLIHMHILFLGFFCAQNLTLFDLFLKLWLSVLDFVQTARSLFVTQLRFFLFSLFFFDLLLDLFCWMAIPSLLFFFMLLLILERCRR